MEKKILTVILLLGISLFWTVPLLGTQPKKIADLPLLRLSTGFKEVNGGRSSYVNPFLSSPGEKLGTTFYDYQHNGTISKMVAVDQLGGVHFCWMNGLDEGATNRHVYYAFVDENGGWLEPQGEGIQISTQRAGYTTLGVLSDGRAVVAYHCFPDQSIIAVDMMRGGGYFIEAPIINPSEGDALWPHVAVDKNDNIHLVAQTPKDPGSPTLAYYCRSTDQGGSFSPWVVFDDSLYDISYDIAASRISGKVGIAYTAPRAGSRDPGQWVNDIYYYESANYGEDFDFSQPPQNITQFAESDSFRAYTDVNLIYDNDDNPHFAFTVYWAAGDTEIYAWFSRIMHWSQKTGLTTVSGPGSPGDTMEGWWYTTEDPGAWRLPADRPSLGIDPNTGDLFCVWVGNRDDDWSAGGFPNGELYAARSQDGGATWGPVVNLTKSPTPGAAAGECDDDDYPSLATLVTATTGDTSLHIIYVNDKDAGGIPQNEGSWTLNPVLYLEVPADSIPSGVIMRKGKGVLPSDYCLEQNYPNPFNPQTNISFTIPKPSTVSLKVYDVSGRLVRILVSGEMSAGEFIANWDGRNESGKMVSSGVYFYRLKAGDFSEVKRMVLIR